MFTKENLERRCYDAWIEENVPVEEAIGNCNIYSRVMAQAFPELILVGGYVKGIDTSDVFFSVFKGSNYHEYLITEKGEKVDPTALQFDRTLGLNNWYYCPCEEHLLYINGHQND